VFEKNANFERKIEENAGEESSMSVEFKKLEDSSNWRKAEFDTRNFLLGFRVNRNHFEEFNMTLKTIGFRECFEKVV
jgi:hypothetical protein